MLAGEQGVVGEAQGNVDAAIDLFSGFTGSGVPGIFGTGGEQVIIPGVHTARPNTPFESFAGALPPSRDFRNDPFVQDLLANISNSLANPDVIGAGTEAQLKSRAREGILARERTAQQAGIEDRRRRNILDSGLDASLRRQGDQASSEAIARAERDIAIERALAREQNERAIQNTALGLTGQLGQIGLGEDRLALQGALGAGQLALGQRGQDISQRGQELTAIINQASLQAGRPILPNQAEFLFELEQAQEAINTASTEQEKAAAQDFFNSLVLTGLNILGTIFVPGLV